MVRLCEAQYSQGPQQNVPLRLWKVAEFLENLSNSTPMIYSIGAERVVDDHQKSRLHAERPGFMKVIKKSKSLRKCAFTAPVLLGPRRLAHHPNSGVRGYMKRVSEISSKRLTPMSKQEHSTQPLTSRGYRPGSGNHIGPFQTLQAHMDSLKHKRLAPLLKKPFSIFSHSKTNECLKGVQKLTKNIIQVVSKNTVAIKASCKSGLGRNAKHDLLSMYLRNKNKKYLKNLQNFTLQHNRVSKKVFPFHLLHLGLLTPDLLSQLLTEIAEDEQGRYPGTFIQTFHSQQYNGPDESDGHT